MAAEKKMHCLYVDGLGKEHPALITAVNQRGDYCPACQSNERSERRVVGGAPCGNDSYHNSTAPLEHYVTLVYVGEHLADSENVVKKYDVKHISMLERETSPGLPSFHVNCWKYEEEEHEALPSDHPAFDHPFDIPEYDEQGKLIATGRPKYASAIAEHHDTLLSMSAGTSAPVPAALSTEPSHDREAKKLADQVTEMASSSFSDHLAAAQSQAPTEKDLDTVAEESKVAEITNGKKKKPIATGK